MVQVGGLSLMNHASVTNNSEQSETVAGFAGILKGLTLQEVQEVQEEKQSESLGEDLQNQRISKTDLTELIDFLNQTTEPEWVLSGIDGAERNAEGESIEDHFDMRPVMMGHVQLTGEEIKRSIETFVTSLTKSSRNVNDEPRQMEIVRFMEELPKMEPTEALQSFVAILPFINVEQSQFFVEKDISPLLKTIKMVELLSDDLTDKSKAGIQDFLQKVSRKLEVLVNENKTSSRLEVLSTAYNPIVKELKGQHVKNNNVHLDDTVISNINNLLYTKKQTTLTENKAHLVNANRMSEMHEPNEIIVNHKLQQKAAGDEGQGLIFKMMTTPENNAGTKLETSGAQTIKSRVMASSENDTKTELERPEHQAVRPSILTTPENSTGAVLEPRGDRAIKSKIPVLLENVTSTELESPEHQAVRPSILTSPESSAGVELEPKGDQAVKSKVATLLENSIGTKLESSGDQVIRSKIMATPENNGAKTEIKSTENQTVRSSNLAFPENSTGNELEPRGDQAIKSKTVISPENSNRAKLEPTEATKFKMLASIENSIRTKLNQNGTQNQAGSQSELDINLTNKAFPANQESSLQKVNLKMNVHSPIQNRINDARVKIANQHHPIEFANGSVFSLPQMTRPEQLTMMLDSSRKRVSAEQLIQQFQAILSKSQFVTTGGTQKLFIKLNPESLGALRIEVIQKDATLIAKIQTTTSIAKEALESQLHNLKHAFHSQNLVVDKIEISQQLIQQERHFNQDPHQQHEQGQQRGQQEQKQPNDQLQETSFQEALLNIEV